MAYSKIGQSQLTKEEIAIYLNIHNPKDGEFLCFLNAKVQIFGEQGTGARLFSEPTMCRIKFNHRYFEKRITNGKWDFFKFLYQCCDKCESDPKFNLTELWERLLAV
jgi:hypothetical protein